MKKRRICRSKIFRNLKLFPFFIESDTIYLNWSLTSLLSKKHIAFRCQLHPSDLGNSPSVWGSLINDDAHGNENGKKKRKEKKSNSLRPRPLKPEIFFPFRLRKNTRPQVAYSNRFRQSTKRWKYDSIPHRACMVLLVHDAWRHDVLENLRFRPSTNKRKSGVFKNLHSHMTVHLCPYQLQ